MSRTADAHSRCWALWHRQFDLVRAVDHETYLTRWWLIKTPWFGIAIHRMLAPDARETLHDHPWAFFSIILRGGYIERRLNPKDMTVDEAHVVSLCNVMRYCDAHAITALTRTPTWTLVFVGRQRRTWGFWEPAADGQEAYWYWTRHTEFDSGNYVP